MKRRFVCLANSYKEKGRCVAGIELDSKNNIILESGRPKWIRPVSSTGHGEIMTQLVEEINILDIIEIDVTEECPYEYQSENVYFNEYSINPKGTLTKDMLNNACENLKYLFATCYPSLSEEVIGKLSNSLILIKVFSFEVIHVLNEKNPDFPKSRLKFEYNGIEYDLPITDPAFLTLYKNNSTILDKKNEIILCLSLGIKYPKTNRYYKLVAGIIY